MSKVLLIILIVFLSFPSLISCGGSTTFGQKADSLFLINEKSKYYYDLKRPDEKHFLPYVLSEISGLTYLEEQKIICVEDEGGRAYIYDLRQREIVHSIKFWQPGDFEGVELVDDRIYVLESDGDIYEFDYSDEKEVKAKKRETPLSRKNDTEGLGYDPESNELLVVCKEDGDTKDYNAKGKAIYRFDLEEKKLKKKARFEISSGDLKSFFEANRNQDYDDNKLKFEPSGIAYHPIEKTFYVLASVGKLLLVLDAEGDIKSSYPIAPRVLNQPEGICFAPNGDMYISSEGEGDRGYILKFEMKERG